MIDLKYALRSLKHAPGFAVTAIVVLGLALGGTVATFSAVSAIFIRPLPYRDSASLVFVEQVEAGDPCLPICGANVTEAQFRRSVQALSGLASLVGLTPGAGVVTTRGGMVRASWAVVSDNFFSVLGLEPSLGRTLRDGDADGINGNVAVLSQTFWRDYFGSDPGAVGKQFFVKGKAYSVIGVLAPGAVVGRPIFYSDSLTPQFYLPHERWRAGTDGNSVMSVLARLKSSTEAAPLTAAVEVAWQNGDTSTKNPLPAAGPKTRVRTSTLRSAHVKEYAASFPIFLGTLVAVLLIASANLAGLFLARLNARRQEVAVRIALGASQGEICRQFATEGLVLAGAGWLAGLIVSELLIGLLRFLPAEALPYWSGFGLNPLALGFAALLAALAGITFGLWPPILLLVNSRAAAGSEALRMPKSGGRSTTRLRQALVAVEISCTLVLLTGAGLLSKTFVNVTSRDIGTAKRSVLRVRGLGSMTVPDRVQAEAQLTALQERLRALPMAVAVGLSGNSPAPPASGMTREGDLDMIPAGVAPAMAETVSPDYFAAVGTPLLAGRGIARTDGLGSPPVAILEDRTARRLFPNENPIGRRIKFGAPWSGNPWMTIIGIAASSRYLLDTEPHYFPAMYTPWAQAPGAGVIAVRVRGNTGAAKAATIRAVHDIMPDAVPWVELVDDRIEQLVAPLRIRAVVLSGFAIFALILAAIGIYGVVAYIVVQRTTEFGIRLALGASSTDISWLMLRSVTATILVGTCGGVVGSVALTRVLNAMLYGTSPLDVGAFLASTMLLLSAVAAATYLPTKKAVGTNPLQAIRHL